MKHRKRQELTAGVFTLVGLLTAMGILIWMSGVSLLARKGQRAYFYAEWERGKQALLAGAPVSMGDTEIGKIVSVEMDLEHKRTVYAADIFLPTVHVYSNASVRVAAPLVGKDVSLAILTCGDAGHPLADRGHAVRMGTGPLEALTEEMDPRKPDSIVARLRKELDRTQEDSFVAKLHRIMDQLDRTTSRVSRIMDEAAPGLVKAVADIGEIIADARPRVKKTLEDVQATVADARPRIKKTLEDVEATVADARPKVARALDDVAKTSARARELVDKDLAELLGRFREINTRILKMMENFEGVSEQARGIVTAARPGIEEIVSNMAALSETLKSTANDVRRSPWRLLHKPTKGEMENEGVLEAARAYSQGASQLEQALSRLKGLDARTADPKAVEEVREHLKKTFSRFKEVEDLLWKELNR